MKKAEKTIKNADPNKRERLQAYLNIQMTIRKKMEEAERKIGAIMKNNYTGGRHKIKNLLESKTKSRRKKPTTVTTQQSQKTGKSLKTVRKPKNT